MKLFRRQPTPTPIETESKDTNVAILDTQAEAILLSSLAKVEAYQNKLFLKWTDLLQLHLGDYQGNRLSNKVEKRVYEIKELDDLLRIATTKLYESIHDLQELRDGPETKGDGEWCLVPHSGEVRNVDETLSKLTSIIRSINTAGSSFHRAISGRYLQHDTVLNRYHFLRLVQKTKLHLQQLYTACNTKKQDIIDKINITAITMLGRKGIPLRPRTLIKDYLDIESKPSATGSANLFASVRPAEESKEEKENATVTTARYR